MINKNEVGEPEMTQACRFTLWRALQPPNNHLLSLLELSLQLLTVLVY